MFVINPRPSINNGLKKLASLKIALYVAFNVDKIINTIVKKLIIEITPKGNE